MGFLLMQNWFSINKQTNKKKKLVSFLQENFVDSLSSIYHFCSVLVNKIFSKDALFFPSKISKIKLNFSKI